VRVLAFVGTRPEAIKTAPVLRALKRRGLRPKLCATAQHRELLDMMLGAFGLKPDLDLDLMRPGQTIAQVLARVGDGAAKAIRRFDPELVLVQGDTSGSLAAARAAVRLGVPVAHIEAGLRSFDRKNPYPEEDNRVEIDRLSTLHFAPTAQALANLRREGMKRALLTGNTGVDALLWAAKRRGAFKSRALRALPPRMKLAVLTLHRREALGGALPGLLRAVRDASARLPELHWVYPVHPNPRVRAAARALAGQPRITLCEPLGYLDFTKLMARAEFLVTDSGGIQEEAPSLGKPVIVVRRKTERPELLSCGGVLVGLSPARLKAEILRFGAGKRPKPARRNPFGDGRASERIADAILNAGV